jgi:hypothetical protein
MNASGAMRAMVLVLVSMLAAVVLQAAARPTTPADYNLADGLDSYVSLTLIDINSHNFWRENFFLVFIFVTSVLEKTFFRDLSEKKIFNTKVGAEIPLLKPTGL